MIKFFRRTRQNLLITNKTGKYLKYAIGEIILVMIGILLALQVSHWNNEIADRKLEKRYLSELILDLRTDSLVILRAKKSSDQQASSKNKLLGYYKEQKIKEDSLIYYFDRQWRNVPKFNPITTTLDEMKSTGNIGVIKNTAIRRKILETYNYYTTHINNIQERYLIQQDALANLVQSNTPDIFISIFEYSGELDITSLLDNFEVKNRLLGNYASGFNAALDSLKTVNAKLITEIRLELEHIKD